jgi:hypothetical protein
MEYQNIFTKKTKITKRITKKEPKKITKKTHFDYKKVSKKLQNKNYKKGPKKLQGKTTCGKNCPKIIQCALFCGTLYINFSE